MTASYAAQLDLEDRVIRVIGEEETYDEAELIPGAVKLTRQRWCYKKGTWSPEGAEWGFEDIHHNVDPATEVELVDKIVLVQAILDEIALLEKKPPFRIR